MVSPMKKLLKWIYDLGYHAGYRDCEADYRLKAQEQEAMNILLQDWDDDGRAK